MGGLGGCERVCKGEHESEGVRKGRRASEIIGDPAKLIIALRHERRASDRRQSQTLAKL